MRRAVARGAGLFFSLLDDRLKIGTEGYSPRLIEKIEYAGGNESSFAAASRALAHLAELPISAKHVQRITERLGRERATRRDMDIEAFRAGTLKPTHAEPPAVAAVHLDAGKLQFRQDDGDPGVRVPHWGDAKVGCFQTYTEISSDTDPQPEPPALFLNPPKVMRLCREMERVRSASGAGEGTDRTESAIRLEEETLAVERPQRLVRTAVATTEATEGFGWMVAAEATKRGFDQAPKKAIVGDGGNWIGPLAELHFPDWVQVLDFLHLLVHLYAAATAAYRENAKQAWARYEQWLRWAWSGQVKAVIAGLEDEAQRLGEPPPRARDDDPRRVVSLSVGYVRSNAYRMDYAQYRRDGLPITSAIVESLIKQFNTRVKGTEKFWINGGAEAVLQVRAAYLSEDDRATTFHDHRPRGRAVGRARLKPAA